MLLQLCWMFLYNPSMTTKLQTKIDSFVGTVHGKLTVTGYSHTDDRRNYVWDCMCECGCSVKRNTKYFSTMNHRGRNASCGHRGCQSTPRGAQAYNWKGAEFVTGSYVTRTRQNARNRGLDFEVDIDYLNTLMISQHHKCKLTGVDICILSEKLHPGETTASLDRVDPSIGYVVGNVQWLHKTVNRIKQNLTEKELLSWCKAIISHADESHEV